MNEWSYQEPHVTNDTQFETTLLTVSWCLTESHSTLVK